MSKRRRADEARTRARQRGTGHVGNRQTIHPPRRELIDQAMASAKAFDVTSVRSTVRASSAVRSFTPIRIEITARQRRWSPILPSSAI